MGLWRQDVGTNSVADPLGKPHDAARQWGIVEQIVPGGQFSAHAVDCAFGFRLCFSLFPNPYSPFPIPDPEDIPQAQDPRAS